MLKICFKCGREMEADGNFYRHPQMADGFLGKCKYCAKIDVRENRAHKIESYRRFDRERFKSHSKRRADIYRTTAELRLRYPDKYKARTALGNAVRSGKITRQPCWCGEVKSQAHHADYSKPLDVIWLCQRHHDDLHHTVSLPF